METIILRIIQLVLIISMLSLVTVFTYYLMRESKLNNLNLYENLGKGSVIGFITDFGDTLGIGSFATTTALFKATKYIDDPRKLPATLNAAHVLPVIFQALLFITTVKVSWTTLVPMTLSAMSGAFIGPKITKNWNAKIVSVALAVALLIAAVLIIIRTLTNPGANLSENVHGLSGILLVVGIGFNFLLGILMTIGLGNYAPELVFFSLVGVNPLIAFPVMMLDAAMIMTVSTNQFIQQKRIQWKGLLGVILGGLVGVLIAVLFVKQLPLNILNWLIVAITIFTAASLIRDFYKK